MNTIRASSIDRLLNCNHSQILPEIENESTSDYAIKGNEQHQIAYNIIEGIEEKREAEDNTLTYIDYIRSRLVGQTQPILWETEKQLQWEWLKGSPDCYLYYPESNLIEIVDLKSGYQEVLPTYNQLKAYAWLVYQNNKSVLDRYHLEIKLTIIQNENVSSISLKLTDIENLINKLLDNNSKHIWATGKHCRYCPSKIHCKKMHELTKLDKNNTEHMIKLVQNKKNIEIMLEEAKDYLITNKKEWFNPKTRNYKYWIDQSKAPTTMKILTPAQALKIDKKYNDNIKELPKITYEIKKEVN